MALDSMPTLEIFRIITSTSKVQKKSLESPDEKLTFEKEKLEI